MTLLRRGIKRLSALFCAALLLLHLGAYPLRARATAGALAAVRAAVTVSAFLMACGIYPYVSEDGQSFGEWGAQSLSDLWGQYVNSFEGGQLPSGGTVETFNQIKSFVVGNTLAIASGTWETLRGFASWIVQKFKVQDNQTGVELSSLPDNISYVPFIPAENILPKSSLLQTSQNIFFGIRGGDTSLPRVKVCRGYAEKGWQYANLVFGVVSDNSYPGAVVEYRTRRNDYGNVIDPDNAELSTNWGSLRYRNSDYPSVVYFALGGQAPDEALSFGAVPSFDTVADTMAFLGGQSAEGTSAVTVDTTTVAPLEPLPADTPYGGLAVSGVGVSPTATAVKDVIETGVTDREKPVVRPVEVEVGAGTEVDGETGEVTENPVVITPGDVVLPASDYQVPGLSGVFPFSLPWDIYRIYSALNAEPVRPEWDVTVYIPVLDIQVPMHIGFPEDVAPAVDNFMSLARKLILIFLCVLTLVGVRNLIR